MTLEWLLIVASMATVGAFSVLAVQRVVDDTVDVPADRVVRVWEADMAAARLAREAQQLIADWINDDEDETDYTTTFYVADKRPDVYFEEVCEAIADSFDDVIESARWRSPLGADGAQDTGDDDTDDDVSALCMLTPRANLAG